MNSFYVAERQPTVVFAETNRVTPRAIAAGLKNNEFSLHYQPQVDAVQGKLVGFEALLRWHSPSQGAVSPAEFIPVAETSDIIHDIWSRVLECVAGDLRDINTSADLHVAVNLSAQQLPREGLADQFECWLASSGLDSSQVHVEITESSFLTMSPVLLRNLDDLRRLGVAIWLDDFGTGYSSLKHLRDLPISGLKVDQSFVHSLADNLEDFRIVSAIVAMANSLGLLVIAEGVETQEQAQILTQLGCDMLQGYLIGRPAPMVDNLRAWK